MRRRFTSHRGLNYHKEMWFFTQGGMSPYEVSLRRLSCAYYSNAYCQALRSATRSSAFNLGLFDSIGSLSSGKLADMVIYPPGVDVLKDISSTTDIRYVIKGGRIWDATDMTEMWPVAGRKPSIPRLNAD
jgi:adenine deaminase